jgi:SAM-dependent methyltransferase
MSTARILGRSPVGAYLRVNEWLWRRLPGPLTAPRPMIAYGRAMNALVRARSGRRQFFGTFFFRNRPQLDLIAGLANERARDGRVSIAVLGCSLGAEVYSLSWTLQAKHPELLPRITGVDISDEALAMAREGVYSVGVSEFAQEPIFTLATERELRGMFDDEGTRLRVKPRLRQGIEWRLGDARDPAIVEELGRQDLVVANDFLCHMEPTEAESCLRNIARLVAPGGYLVVSGIDLDVRAKVARALGWTPVSVRLEEIHDGDRTLRLSWPWRYWGLEPFDETRPDRLIRYASAFRLGAER